MYVNYQTAHDGCTCYSLHVGRDGELTIQSLAIYPLFLYTLSKPFTSPKSPGTDSLPLSLSPSLLMFFLGLFTVQAVKRPSKPQQSAPSCSKELNSNDFLTAKIRSKSSICCYIQYSYGIIRLVVAFLINFVAEIVQFLGMIDKSLCFF